MSREKKNLEKSTLQETPSSLSFNIPLCSEVQQICIMCTSNVFNKYHRAISVSEPAIKSPKKTLYATTFEVEV